MSFTLMFSVGKYGGFHLPRFGEKRKVIPGREIKLVLGWIEFTFFTPEFDEYMNQVGRNVFGERWIDYKK